MNRLDDLAVQTAEHFGVEVPDLRVTNRDPELAQIQQVEATADLLEAILKSVGVEVAEPEVEASDDNETEAPAAEDKKASKKGARKTRRKK